MYCLSTVDILNLSLRRKKEGCSSSLSDPPRRSPSTASSLTFSTEMDMMFGQHHTHPRIPPLYIDHIPDWHTHAAAIHRLTGGGFTTPCSKGEFIVTMTSISNVRTVQAYLFTRSLPATRLMKIVFSGLQPFVTAEDVQDTLTPLLKAHSPCLDSFITWNCSSIRNRRHELIHFLQDYDVDIISVQELVFLLKLLPPGRPVILAGDFNSKHVDWDYNLINTAGCYLYSYVSTRPHLIFLQITFLSWNLLVTTVYPLRGAQYELNEATAVAHFTSPGGSVLIIFSNYLDSFQKKCDCAIGAGNDTDFLWTGLRFNTSLINFNGFYRNILQSDGRTSWISSTLWTIAFISVLWRVNPLVGRQGLVYLPQFKAEAFANVMKQQFSPNPVDEDPAHSGDVYLWLEAFDREGSDDEDVGELPPVSHTEVATSISRLRPWKAGCPDNLGSAAKPLNSFRNGRCVGSV
ncbi:hypothetical protein J6590_018129 [Homalodisca vitripennis]|nr:hypothetical protein J6590_018129 [Homalodisca vitripennis]